MSMNIKKKTRLRKMEDEDDRESDDDDFSGNSGKHQRLKKLKVEDKEDGKAPSAPQHEEGQGEFKIKRKKNQTVDVSSDNKKEENKERNLAKAAKYKIERFNLNKVFEEVIDAAYKDESLMMIMKNILSAGKRALNDKQAQLKKRWQNLGSSNLSEKDYKMKKEELQKSESDEIRDIKEDIYNKLCSSKIRGFDTRDTILENFKRSINKTNESLQPHEIDEALILEIQEREFQNYKNAIMDLLDKLLIEKIFTEDADLPIKFHGEVREARRMGDLRGDKRGESMESQRPYERMVRENKGPKSQRRKVTCQIGKDFIENENRLNEYLNIYDVQAFYNVQDKDRLLLKKSEVPVINNSTVERSNDELYLQEQFERNTKMLQDLDKKSSECNGRPDYDTLKDLVYLTNFVMYNLHSYQKYNIERSMIHPSDLLYLLNRYS